MNRNEKYDFSYQVWKSNISVAGIIRLSSRIKSAILNKIFETNLENRIN